MENTIVTKKDCGPDKILNVKTNRCLKKKKTKKCGPGKFLNMKTNRCVKKKKTKRCGPGKFLNMKTNRCVKKKSIEIAPELRKFIQFVSHPKVSFFIIIFTSLHYKKLIFDSTVNVKNIYTLRLWEILNYRRILGISFSYILLYYQLYSSKSIDEKRIELFLITGSYALLLKYENAIKLFIETYLWSKLLGFLRKLFQQPEEEQQKEEEKEEQECECDCDQTQQPPDEPDIENPIRQIIKQMVKGIGSFFQNIVFFTGSKIFEAIKYISNQFLQMLKQIGSKMFEAIKYLFYQFFYYIFIQLPYYIFIYPFVLLYNSIFTKAEFKNLMKDIQNQVEEKIKETTAVQKENIVKIYQNVVKNVLQNPVKRDIVYQEAFPSKKTNLSDLVRGKPYEPVGNWNAKKAKQSLEHKPFFVGPDYFQEKILLPEMRKNKDLKLRPYIRKTKNTMGDEFYLIQYEKVKEYDSNDPDSKALTTEYDSNDPDSNPATKLDNYFLTDSYKHDKMLIIYESDKSQSSSMFLPSDQNFLHNMKEEIYGVQPTDPTGMKEIVTVVVPAKKGLYESFKANIDKLDEKLEDATKFFKDLPDSQTILVGLSGVLLTVTVGGMLYYIPYFEVPYAWDLLGGLKNVLQITIENPQDLLPK